MSQRYCPGPAHGLEQGIRNRERGGGGGLHELMSMCSVYTDLTGDMGGLCDTLNIKKFRMWNQEENAIKC